MNYVLMGRAARGEDENESVTTMFRMLFGADAAEAENFYDAVKKLILKTGHCHIPYPRSLLRRTELKDYQQIHELALKLAAKAPEDPLRADLTVWTEYMIKFKQLFDAYQAKALSEADVHAFLDWVHSHREGRVFVHSKFDSYFRALLDALHNGTEWIHFNIDWEDDYIRRHDRVLG